MLHEGQDRGGIEPFQLPLAGADDDTQAAVVGLRSQDVVEIFRIAVEVDVLVQADVWNDGRLAAESLPDCFEGGFRRAEIDATQTVNLLEVAKLMREVAARVNHHAAELLRQFVHVWQTELTVQIRANHG